MGCQFDVIIIDHYDFEKNWLRSKILPNHLLDRQVKYIVQESSCQHEQ